jgi:hypothetical protein
LHGPRLFQDPLFVDGVLDPCHDDRDRGTLSQLVYTVVHLNYHLLFLFAELTTMRLGPVLLRELDRIKDQDLGPLRGEVEQAERTDPDRVIPRPPRPAPVPIPPGPDINI